MKPRQSFSATEGTTSSEERGPVALMNELYELRTMFDPQSTHKNKQPGGIGEENIRPGAINDSHISLQPINSGISIADFNGTGSISILLSYLAKTLESVTGQSWYKGYPVNLGSIISSIEFEKKEREMQDLRNFQNFTSLINEEKNSRISEDSRIVNEITSKFNEEIDKLKGKDTDLDKVIESIQAFIQKDHDNIEQLNIANMNLRKALDSVEQVNPNAEIIGARGGFELLKFRLKNFDDIIQGLIDSKANKTDIPTIPTSLPANGGNANTVGGVNIFNIFKKNAVAITDIKNINNDFCFTIATPTTLNMPYSDWWFVDIKIFNSEAIEIKATSMNSGRTFTMLRVTDVWKNWIETPISNGTLQTNLNAELLGGKRAGDFLGKNETAVAANKFPAPRTISITGDVYGTGLWDGAGNLVINTKVGEVGMPICNIPRNFRAGGNAIVFSYSGGPGIIKYIAGNYRFSISVDGREIRSHDGRDMITPFPALGAIFIPNPARDISDEYRGYIIEMEFKNSCVIKGEYSGVYSGLVMTAN